MWCCKTKKNTVPPTRNFSAGFTPIVDFGVAASSRALRATPKFTTGFTLIELLVCLVIISILTAMVLPSRKQFEESLNLTNLAYDIALVIREAQVYSTNTRQTDASGTFDMGYGVQVTTNSTSFKLFADLNHNHIYDNADLIIRNYTIGGGSKVQKFCIVSGVPTCVDYVVGFPSLYISFKRPDSEACMTVGSVNALSTPNCIALMQISEGRITIESSGGRTKVIKVFANGQISVQ